MISSRWDALFCVLLWPLLVVFVVCAYFDGRMLLRAGGGIEPPA